MQRRANHLASKKKSASNNPFQFIPLSEIEPSPNNTRKHINKDKLVELAGSIRQNSLLQPILVRVIVNPKPGRAKYQIIAGERRFRAAKIARLKEIPAYVKSMGEGAALNAQIVENLHREEIHPLDEADGFLCLKEVEKLGISEVAQRIAKDERYVARRLSLTNLIEEAREDLREERITLAHALEIARLAPEIQVHALAACYERTFVYDREARTNSQKPDKEKPARHVRYLQEWLRTNVHLNLNQAPFKKEDSRLRDDGLTCIDCPNRTGRDKALFDDIQETDTCLNPLCFQAKLQQLVQIRKSDIEVKSNKPVALISAFYGSGTETNDAIGKEHYHVIERKTDRCEFAEQAVIADGTEIGKVKWICRESSCKDHKGRIAESHRSYSTTSLVSRSAAPADRNHRKQELFDIKVDEEVRKRVMKEAIKTYSWPLERVHLNESVKEFYRRIPTEHQRVICEVMQWNDNDSGKLRYEASAILERVAALRDTELGQFMMLCSFAHYGANQYKNNRVAGADRSIEPGS
jgi:ParB/RepB/Spo0J family partition protein